MADRAPELLRAVAAHGLAGGTVPIVDVALPADEWAVLLAAAVQERLTGLLHAAVLAGAWAATPEQAVAAADAHAEAMCEVLVLERMALAGAALLEDHGIDVRVLKGPAAAHLDYPDPALRSFIDIDFLVRSGDIDGAALALTGAGYHRRFAEPRPGFDRRFGKGASFSDPAGRYLDLHRTFVLGPFGLAVDLDTVWAGHDAFRLAGRALSALSPPDRFANACLHAVLGDRFPRLVPLRDVAQMTVNGAITPAELDGVVATWGAGVVVAEALATAGRVLGLDPDLALLSWARAYRPEAAEQRALAVYRDPRASSASKAAACVWAIPAWRDRFAYAAALIVSRARRATASAMDDGRRSWPGARRSLSRRGR